MFVQPLDGPGSWHTSNQRSDSRRLCRCVHLDLRAKKIEDPFDGDNELKVSWVHEADWEYSRAFTADERLLDGEKIFLECDGLDTSPAHPERRADRRDIEHVHRS